ncbi:phosphatidate cytidylyltransferase [Desulfobulbus alkaliphilus]|uniref:phosphatidate cytidylyltransferase n=1 Tax=Desulfobulbus alkaliphilus TaxID=869814 RepID=UPI0019647FA7|nr:phosphatidate cytidylyltransferase [Desulfobulbus alkaliphilus]MBM9535874.1 phosphatidate cytidylyltransferase [Desulfobulbus alkaliphilus]
MSRVIPGILMAGGWLLLLLYGAPLLFGVVLLGAAGVALHEFFRMTRPSLSGSFLSSAIVFSLIPVLAACTGREDLVLAGVVFSLLATVFVALSRYSVREDVFANISCTGFAILYISLCIAHVVLLRFHDHGSFWLILLTAVVAGSDTGAYYAGRAFGKRKLFPQISPKKTIAGSVGGLLAGLNVAGLLYFFAPADTGFLVLVASAALLVVVGIAGDLTESMIKRSMGVKDSGTILFGHGGILDRIDSLLLTGPVLYYLLHFGILP